MSQAYFFCEKCQLFRKEAHLILQFFIFKSMSISATTVWPDQKPKIQYATPTTGTTVTIADATVDIPVNTIAIKRILSVVVNMVLLLFGC